MESTKSQSTPEEIALIAQRFGLRIKAARVHRKWRQDDLAVRSSLSRSTIQSIERGDPKVAFESILRVLWVLGLAREVELLADPGLDQQGLALTLDVTHRRVSVGRTADDDF